MLTKCEMYMEPARKPMEGLEVDHSSKPDPKKSRQPEERLEVRQTSKPDASKWPVSWLIVSWDSRSSFAAIPCMAQPLKAGSWLPLDYQS
jgi:hypothetical protein